MLMAYRKNQKGQDLVEYALMLAIIIGIGWGIYTQTGLSDSIKNVFGNASSLMEMTKKQGVNLNWDEILKRLREVQSNYNLGNLTSGMNYRRGVIQSGWLTEDDKKDPTIGKLASELGATMWTYYNGQNPYKSGLESGVLYWTTENLDSARLPKDDNGNWSKETVLSYRYDPKTKLYSVIENRVWLGQPGADGQPHNGLAQLPGEYGKPAGKTLYTCSTYEEAKEKYNEVKTQQGGYIYMGTMQTK